MTLIADSKKLNKVTCETLQRLQKAVRLISCLSSIHYTSITFTSLASFNLCIQYVFITYTICCYVFEKTKEKSKNEQRKKECLFIIRPEEGAHWGNTVLKGCGSKVKSLLWTLHLKISDSGRHSCLISGWTSTFLFSPKHPDLCDGACV